MNDGVGAFSLGLLALPGVALLIVARTLHRPTTDRRRSEMQRALRMAGLLLLLLAIFGTSVGLIGVFAFFGVPLAAVVLLMVSDRYRRSEHLSLLYALAVGAKRNVPLSASARAFADENGSDSAVRALVLAETLDSGVPLPEAARRARLKLGLATRLSLRLGTALGDLGSVLVRALDDFADVDAALRSMVGKLYYLLQIAITLLMVLTFLMLKIVPVYVRMFEDFEIRLPRSTQLLSEISAHAVRYDWPLLVLIAPVAVVALVLGVLYFIGWLPADLPIVNLFTRRYDSALVLRGIAQCVRRGLPLTTAIELVAREFGRRSTARRVMLSLAEINAGQDWRDSFRRRGLLRAGEAAVLRAAQRVGNLEWALDEMADSILRRLVYRLQLVHQIAFPLLLLAFGVVVAFVVTSLFLPLIALIQGLA